MLSSSSPLTCNVPLSLACVVCGRSCVRNVPVSFSQRRSVSKHARVLSILTTISNCRNAICVWIRGMEGGMERYEIIPTSRLAETHVVPGSKSYTNRALTMAALARGLSTLYGALESDDTRVAREA